MSRQIVYLGGPINGRTDEEATGWRNEVKPLLEQKGYLALDPMVRDYRGKEDQCVKEIVENDKLDIQQSRILLMFSPQPSVGTAMEVYFGWSIKRRVIVVVPEGAPVSPWLRYHASEVFIGTPMEAVEALL